MIRIGIVDFDSSHSLEFTQRLNHVGVDREQWVEGARVVLGCPGTSETSPERVPLFTEGIRACGVELVDDPAAMIGRIDAVLVLSVCGRPHLARVRPFLEAGVPAYVDKPFACSPADAEEIVRLANQHGTLVFGTSALRYAEEVLDFQAAADVFGEVHGVATYGPGKRHPHNPGLFHYGIHSAELLFTLMGPGCESVSTLYTDECEQVTARWGDGRIGTLRGNRVGATAYGFVAFCEQGVVARTVSTRYAYRNLLQRMVASFETGAPAVDPLETLEITRFVVASLQSERTDADYVALADAQDDPLDGSVTV